MANQLSVEMLAINFASRTFDYQRLAQDLRTSVFAISSLMREYLDLVVKADQCAQKVDDIGNADNNATDLPRNSRAVFECIRKRGLKLTVEKYYFGVQKVPFFESNISPEEISSQARKIQNVLNKLRFPKIFYPAQLKISIYSKKLWAYDPVFLEFAQILWEAATPTIVSTDNKSVTRFFRTKSVPSSL